MPKQPKPPDKTERLFMDTMRRAIAIPPDEARAIVERTAPGRPRRVPSLYGKAPRKGAHRG